MTKRVLSIIPARGGSKGLPRKNIIDLAGKPLIAWTIEASLKSKYITKTIVSSDDEEILDISKKYGANTVKRPANLASDNASSESVVNHAIKQLSIIDEEYETVILLQPTSPLRASVDIDNAFEIMLASDATAVVSVCKFDNKVLKAFVKKSDGFLNGVYDNKLPFMRRQDLPSVYMPNGAIYIIQKDKFLMNSSFFTPKCLAYEMDAESSIDIDTLQDLKEAKKKITNERLENNNK